MKTFRPGMIPAHGLKSGEAQPDTTQMNILKNTRMAFSFHSCESDHKIDTNVII